MRALLLCVALVACGDNEFGEGRHAPLPQVIDAGGPIIASPRLVVVTFPGDPISAQIEQFVTQLGTSEYWTSVVSEYGVGSASMVPVHSEGLAPPTIDDFGVQAFLLAHLDPVVAGWPSPDDNTIYAVYYPATTTFADCTNEAGYHSEIDLSNGQRVPYVMVPRCGYGLSTIDDVTEVSSHEFVEVTTDPLITSPAYSTASDFAWSQWQGGGELGDMCQRGPGSVITDPSLGHYVQRMWSNAEAAAGHDPCVPHPPGDVYFQAAPVATDMVTLSFPITNVMIPSSGLHIPVHTTRTVDVQLFSDAPTAPISVSAREWPIAALVEEPGDVAVSLDRASGLNGDTLHLTITVKADSVGEGHEYFVVQSQVGDLIQDWPVVIAN